MSEQTITINVQARGVQTTTKKMNGLTASLRAAGRAAHGAAIGMAIVGGAVAGTGRKLIKAADAYTNLTNQTKVFSNSSGQAAFKMQDTINIARKMNASLSEVGTVYQRISMVQAGAGFDDDTASKMVENLTKAVKLSGATAQEAEGALRQFSQGLAANRLSGQELNSVLEQTPMIAQLLAEKLGVATGALRQMGKDGLLTTKVLVDTFGGSIDSLEKKFSKFQFTLEAQMVSVRRELTLASGKLMHMSKVSDGLASSIKELVTGPLIRLNAVLEKGGPEAEKMAMIFKTVLGAAIGIAIVAAGGFVIAILAMIGPIGIAVVAIAGLAGAMIGYQKAAEGTIGGLDKLISRQSRMIEEANRLPNQDPSQAKQMVAELNRLVDKRKELVTALKAEQKAQDDKTKNNAKSIKSFIDGTISMAQAMDAVRYGADADTVIELNKQKALAATATAAREAAAAQVEAQQELIETYDMSGESLKKYNTEMLLLDSLVDVLDPEVFKEMAAAIAAAHDASNPLVQAQMELADAQQAIREKYDEAGEALKTYNAEIKILEGMNLDTETFNRLAAGAKAALDATNPLIEAQKELVELQDALKSKHDATGQAIRDYNADMATLVSMQDDLDTTTFDRMKASIEEAKDEASGLNAEFDRLISNIESYGAKAAKDLSAGMSVANQVQADAGNAVPGLQSNFQSDTDSLRTAMDSPDASQADIEAMQEALELRAQSHEMDLLQAEHKASMLEMNQGLMDQTITLGELTAGVTAGMAQGFMNVAKQAFNISGQIANMTSFAINGLADSITSLAMGGKADFKALGLAFVKMIIQMIVKLTIMMALITAISMIPGGSAVLQMMGMGAGGGGAAASTAVGPVAASAPTGLAAGNPTMPLYGFASGGPVSGGTPIMVGERGPELFVPPQSGSIKNNTTTQSMMQQEAPQVTVVNVDSSQNTLDALGSEEGENLIMNVIQRNPEVLRAL